MGGLGESPRGAIDGVRVGRWEVRGNGSASGGLFT